MAVDFGMLAQVPSIGRSFMAGQEAAQAEQERNMLRQQQAEQMQFQRENMLAQRGERQVLAQERAAKTAQAAQRQKFLTDFGAKLAEGGYKLDRPTLGQMLQAGVQSGEDMLVKLASEGLKALDEEDLYRREAARFGLPGAAAAPEPAAAAAPANALAAPAGFTREQVQNMLTSPSARIREQGKALVGTLPKEPTKTSAQQDYELAKSQGFTGTFMEYKQALQPKPAQVNVKLPEQEKAFEGELGKGQAKKLIEDKAVADDARNIISTVQEGRRLLKSGIITGFGANFLTGLGAALNQAGINFAEDSVANTQAFTANMAANVGRIIKQFGAGTGLSNADREYAEKMAGGKVTLDRKSLEKILDINERAARNVIALHNRNAAKVKTNIPLTVEEPSKFSPVDQQALDWANANPADPRAAAIKQRLGVQ